MSHTCRRAMNDERDEREMKTMMKCNNMGKEKRADFSPLSKRGGIEIIESKKKRGEDGF